MQNTRAIALLTCILTIPAISRAQDTTGKVTGVVTDASGATVPNVSVTVTNEATNAGKTVATNNSGVYQVAQLPIGLYRVTVEAAGFEKTTIDSKTALQINQTLRVDVRLSIGKVTSAVTVESAGSQVETENSTLGATVTGQAIFELPLNGRDTLDLLKTQPGVSASNMGSSATGNYSIGGMRTDSVTYLLDGGLNNNLLNNAAVADPNPDAVAEFRVLENNYSAEYGRSAGGIVSVVTKSGTNQHHGTAYDYLRNNFFDANSFFNNQQNLQVPVLKRNQYGGTIGGPVVKDKLFFFFSYEGQKQTALDTSPGKVTAFTPAEEDGDFSQSAGSGLVATFLQGHPYYQGNPALAGQGIIDPTKIDPVAKAFFANRLPPVSTVGFVFPQAASTNNFNEYLGKFDYNLSAANTVSGTFTTRDQKVLLPFGPSPNPPYNVPGFPIRDGSTTYFGSISYMHTFTPALLNELRVTAQRAVGNQGVPATKNPTAMQLGMNLPSDDPTGPPELAFLGSNVTTGPSLQGPTSLVNNTYAFYDNLSWNKGAHNVKTGFYFSPYQNNTDYEFIVNGLYEFYGSSTSVGSGLDLADFLMGNPDEYVQYPKAPSNIRSHQYAGFVQDGWHVSRRLTLNLGLRYEYAQPKYDTHGRTFSFIPGLQSEVFPNAPNGLVFPGDGGAPRGSNFADKTNFSPRFGFAWDVFGMRRQAFEEGLGCSTTF